MIKRMCENGNRFITIIQHILKAAIIEMHACTDNGRKYFIMKVRDSDFTKDDGKDILESTGDGQRNGNCFGDNCVHFDHKEKKGEEKGENEKG